MVAETVTARNIYTFSPFGNPYAGTVTETVYNPFQFTGQWFDAEITQYYLRARQYDPTMMRFMTRDSVRGEQHDPLSLHKYLYCLNDPLNGTDYTGESAIQIAQGIRDWVGKALADGATTVKYVTPCVDEIPRAALDELNSLGIEIIEFLFK